MKIKIANLGKSFCGLSLLFVTGMAFALPEVESHTRSGWVNASPSGDPDENPTLDLLRKVEFLQQEVQELRGKVEEQNYQISQLKDNQKKLHVDPAQSPVGVSSESSGVTIDSSDMPLHPAGPVNSSTLGAAHDVGMAEEKAYQQAYHLLQNKNFNDAQLAFKSLIKSFPTGKYIPNAHYWLGEIYMAKGDLSLAYESFDSVYKLYPQHPKAADCLLKLGYVEYAKGQWKRSQELLAQVKNQFPGSTSAQLADARLQRMHKEGHL
jgi:tol-pal system protein YbgF